MSDEERSEEIRRLEALVGDGAGAMAFPLLAEAWRRAGRPEEAERVAREGLARAPHAGAGRVALALALLDQKRSDEASLELERLLGGESEHEIAGDAAAADAPEGLDASAPAMELEPPSAAREAASPSSVDASAREVRGELATLDPYPFGSVDEVGSLSAEEGARENGHAEPEPPSVPAATLEAPAVGPFGPPPPPAPVEPIAFDGSEVHDDELDEAFEQAESDREQMVGADDVAAAALATVSDDEDEDASETESPDEFARAVAPQSPFATATFAGLLERQGHGAEAEQIRASLASPTEADDAEADAGDPGAPPEAASHGHEHRATLERWLDNLRRDKG